MATTTLILPLRVLTAAVGQHVSVETKTGETFTGILKKVDNWMNLVLESRREEKEQTEDDAAAMSMLTMTSPNGERFWKLKECSIRGSAVSSLRVDVEAIDRAANAAEQAKLAQKQREEFRQKQQQQQKGKENSGLGRGGRGGRGAPQKRERE
eukprot:PhM_4_TR13507/c0_g1_i1/m.65044/K12623/LSM4; U6 snRNA-associated Sm-like protein LSm4